MDWTLAIGSLNFGIYDIIVVSVMLLSGISGIAVGFSRSVLKILAYFVAFPLALLFVEPLSVFVTSKTGLTTVWASLLSYVVLCVFIFILVKMLGNLLGSAFETLSLGWLDSVLGVFFSIIIAAMVLLVLLELASLQSFVDLTPLKENSIIYTRFFCAIFPTIDKALKGALVAI